MKEKAEETSNSDAQEVTTTAYVRSPSPALNGGTRSRTKRGRNPDRKRHGARNQHRHKLFVKWLEATFPLLLLSGKQSQVVKSDLEDPHLKSCSETEKQREPKHHILDVAGGKGEVAARLCMCLRQNVVMVDPRPADIVQCFETCVLPKIPNKWQHRIETRRQDNPKFVEETIQSRFRQLVTTFDDQSVQGSEELRNAIQKSSLLLGVHADGATEAIVDAALEFQKPFVVVPCCVFPNLFRSRQIEEPDGTVVPVRSHEQFCTYLSRKDSRFKVEILPFEGRNVAVWWDGK